MFKPCPSRWFYVSELLIIVGLLAFAYYLEFFQGLAPCALCEVQRLVFALLGVLFFMAIWLPLKRWPQVLINLLLSMTALLGVLFASRQVWLQYLPSQLGMGSCDVSLYYLLQVMPLSDVLLNVFLGGPECAKITWQFLHLSIAAWALLWFAAFFLLALWQGLGWLFSRR